MKCPICGNKLNPNKGWANEFYAGYCNHCDMPIEHEIAITDEEKDSNVFTNCPRGGNLLDMECDCKNCVWGDENHFDPHTKNCISRY